MDVLLMMFSLMLTSARHAGWNWHFFFSLCVCGLIDIKCYRL